MGKTKEVKTRTVEIPVREPKSEDELYTAYLANIAIRKASGESIEPKARADWNKTDNGESRQMRATRVGTGYVNTALEAVRRIKNLSAGSYSLTDKQVDTIVNELTKAVDEVKNALHGAKSEAAKVTL